MTSSVHTTSAQMPKRCVRSRMADSLLCLPPSPLSTPLNLGLHLLTTPLAVTISLSAVSKACGNSWLICSLLAAYLMNMALSMPPFVFCTTVVSMSLMVLAAELTRTRLSWRAHALLFCVGYFGQDLAHFCAGEATLQSTYQKDDDFWAQLLEHTYYLIPLVFDALLPESAPSRTQAALLSPKVPLGRQGELLASVATGGIASMLWILHNGRGQRSGLLAGAPASDPKPKA